MDEPQKAKVEPGGGQGGLRLLLEMGPLVAFFIANSQGGIFVATAVFMVAIVLSLAVSWFVERRLPIMPLVTAVFVLVFGGLTLYLEDEQFIKLKPTIVNVLFGGALLIGLAFGRVLLKPVFGTAFELTDEGWRILTLRWGLFLLSLAVLNEYVWRSFDTDAWVTFKVWGILPLTVVFSLLQMPLLNRYQVGEEA